MTRKTGIDAVLQRLWIVIIGVCLMLAGGLIAGGYFVASLRANDRAIIAQRDEARHAVCVKDNEQSDKAADAARKTAEVLIATARKTGSQTPQAVTDAYIADQVAAAREIWPKRECTPEAIEDYYQQQAALR